MLQWYKRGTAYTKSQFFLEVSVKTISLQANKRLIMKELLKKIIFEQQEYCKNIAQETVPRGIEEEWLTTTSERR